MLMGEAPDGTRCRAAQGGRALRELGVEVELIEAIGEISAAIVEVADTYDVGLIVLGTSEPSQVERMPRHSVSEQVQRMPHCDVLICH